MARQIVNRETGEIQEQPDRFTEGPDTTPVANGVSRAIERARMHAGLPAVPDRFEMPRRVESGIPERAVPLKELVDGPDLVVIGTRGEVFNPGQGLVIRMVWQYADAWGALGPDREAAYESLVPFPSIPAKVAAECQESGSAVLARVTMRESKGRPGQTYYQLV